MERGVGHGLAATPWTSDDPHAHVRRAAGFFAWSQTEPGHGCPISMTYAAVPALRADDALAKEWTPRLASTVLRLRAPAGRRQGRRAGRHGHDREAGRLRRPGQRHRRATPTAVDGEYTLDGHKWFTSAPDERRVPGARPGRRRCSRCFLVPRVLADGSRNRLDVVRLKDKLGNRSNASSELEFRGTWAQRLGDEGRGVRTIIEMVAATRLDCVLGSASLMRRALAEASWHVAHRSAFGGAARRQAADAERHRRPGRRVRGRHRARPCGWPRPSTTAHDPHEAALRRIALPLAKYWVCKRTPMMVAEALECLGGNGYVEESGLPLLYRESPLNSVWEGSGNVNALDVLRALSREPEALNAWIVEVGRARGEDPRLDRAIDGVLESLADTVRARGRRPPAGRPDGRLPPGRPAGAVRARRGRRRVLRHPARHGVRRHARHPAARHRPRLDRPADHARRVDRRTQPRALGDRPRESDAVTALGTSICVAVDDRMRAFVSGRQGRLVDVVEILERAGGIADRASLVALTSRAEVDRALGQGAVVRDGHGRYALPVRGRRPPSRERPRRRGVPPKRSPLHGWELQDGAARAGRDSSRRNRKVAGWRRKGIAVHRGPSGAVRPTRHLTGARRWWTACALSRSTRRSPSRTRPSGTAPSPGRARRAGRRRPGPWGSRCRRVAGAR